MKQIGGQFCLQLKLLLLLLLFAFCEGQLKSYSSNQPEDIDYQEEFFEEVIAEGQLISKPGSCLEATLENNYEYVDFNVCNGSNSQNWTFLSNGELVQTTTGLCLQNTVVPANMLYVGSCNYSLSEWTIYQTHDYLYIMLAYETLDLLKKCLAVESDMWGIYNKAELVTCDPNDDQQLFNFDPPPQFPASPPPPSSPPSPSMPPSPSNNGSRTRSYVVISVITIVIFSLPFLIVIIYKAVTWKRTEQHQEYSPLQSQGNSFDFRRRHLEEGRVYNNDSFDFSHLDLKSSLFTQDNSSNSSDWWAEIQIPNGVREIPITDFKRIRKLGAGGFAKVYQVEFKEHAKHKYGDLGDQQVALKVVFKEYVQMKDSVDAILKEVEAMSKLDNEYIVKLLGASLVIRPTIVMELVPQGSLEQLLYTEGYKSHQTPLLWKLKLMLSISKGIQYLHSQNVIHRDLKPANILIKDRDAAVTKISDFGLAKIQQVTQSNPHTNIAGTTPYMAPEMFENKLSDAIDEKVDIWALGIIMQYILRGIRPWEQLSDINIVCKISVHKEAPDNGDLPRSCPQDLSALIKSCWKDPAERPSAEEIVLKLQVILIKESFFANFSNKSSSSSCPF